MISSQADLNQIAASLQWRSVHFDDRRASDVAIFSLDPGSGEARQLIDLHEAQAEYETPLPTGSSLAAMNRTLQVLHVSSEELLALPEAGPILRLLQAYGLRRAISVRWLLATEPCWDATWATTNPAQWELRRLGTDTGLPMRLAQMDRLVLPRPGGLNDHQLEATLAFREALRRMGWDDRPFHQSQADRIVEFAADAIRRLTSEDGSLDRK